MKIKKSKLVPIKMKFMYKKIRIKIGTNTNEKNIDLLVSN